MSIEEKMIKDRNAKSFTVVCKGKDLLKEIVRKLLENQKI